MMKRIILILAAVLLGTASLAAQNVAPFKDGDRVVFLGDSITDGGHYHSFIWLWYLTRYPDMDIRVFNAGIGGDTVKDMYERLDGEVFPKRPTVVLVTFGMNDTGYFEYNHPGAEEYGQRRLAECAEKFAMLEERLRTVDGMRIILLGGSPYDEFSTFKGEGMAAEPFKGKNEVLRKVSDMMRKSAEANGWEFMDFNDPMVAAQAKILEKNPEWTYTMLDRIHPDNDGHMLMAYLFLESQGFKGSKVAETRIDARKESVLVQDNCEISSLSAERNVISFDYLAHALPYPLDTIPRGWQSMRSQAQVLDIVPFMEDMNQEILAVEGLKGEWSLEIDGVELGTWNADQWKKGINLAELTFAPQYQQAMEVMHLNEYRWDIEREFRDYSWIQYNFFQEKGLLEVNDMHSAQLLDKEKAGNVWLMGHRGKWERLRLKNVREARLREIEMLSQTMNQINNPQTRRVVLKRK